MFFRIANILLAVVIASVLCSGDVDVKTEEDLGVKYANQCEVCKVLATELQNRLEETGKVHDVIEIGYSLDDVQPKKKTKYQKSELRLIESLEGVCDKILEYNIHKERQDSTRFAKGMSQTFKTLHGLVDKGVKVDLGIPYELWDKPSAEITHLKTQCETLLEENEDAIEYWYWNLQGTKDLKLHLCSDHALTDSDSSCLYEDINLRGDIGGKLVSKEKLKIKANSAEPSVLKEEITDAPTEDEDEDEEPTQDHNASMQTHKENNATPNTEQETEYVRAVKEKFLKLYEAGLINFRDPNTFIDYKQLLRRKREFLSDADKQRLKEQYIKEGLLKEQVIKEYEPKGEFDFWKDHGAEDWWQIAETKESGPGVDGVEELMSHREEL